MKKLLILMAVALVALCHVSCDGDSPEPYNPEGNSGAFIFKVFNVTQTSYEFSITAKDDAMYEEGYVYTYFQAPSYRDLYEQYGNDPKAFIEAVVQRFLADLKEDETTFEDWAVYDYVEDYDMELAPATDQYIMAFRYDENYELLGDISYCKITTLAPEVKQTVQLNLQEPLYDWYPLEEQERGILWLKATDEEKNLGLFIELATRLDGPDRRYVTHDLWSPSVCFVVQIDKKEASAIWTIDLTGTEDKATQTYTFSGEAITKDGIRYTFSNVKATYSDYITLFDYDNDLY